VNDRPIKPLLWIASSRKDLRGLPLSVRRGFGLSLFAVQEGEMPLSSKPLKGFSGAGVLELIEDERDSTYRAVYTVRFSDAVYVLHVFQKKSKHGIATPKHEIDLIHDRLKLAQSDYADRKKEPNKWAR
jgi:phage-related protein